MRITEAEEFTKKLLKRHLPKDYKNWKVVFIYDGKIGGTCDMEKKTILLSLYAIQRASTEQMEDICKHEVAHAFACTHFNSKGHDYKWENVCKYVLKCSTNITISLDEEIRDSTSKNHSSNFAEQLTMEFENYGKEASKFFLEYNVEFVKATYLKYMTKFKSTPMYSINKFDKVLYYHLLKTTNTTNPSDLNQALEHPVKIILEDVLNTYNLIIANEELRSEYRNEVLKVLLPDN